MKASDVKAMTDDQLGDELINLKKEQFNLRFQQASGQIENTARVRQARSKSPAKATCTREQCSGASSAAEPGRAGCASVQPTLGS